MQKTKFILIALLGLFLQNQNCTAQTFTALGDSITDDSQYNYFPINVPVLNPADLTPVHGLVKVCMDIRHTYDSDLQVALVRPSGVAMQLFASIGNADDNFTGTCFTATAPLFINAASPPFTGTYRANLGNANNGDAANGVWKLRIIDVGPADKGKLISWSVTFGNNAAAPLPIESNLPIVTITTANYLTIIDEPKTSAVMRIYNNETGAINHTTDIPIYKGNIGIEIRGNYSAILPQKPYSFETRDSLGQPQDTSLLGMPKEHDWCLLANYNDKVMLRNSLAYRLSRKMGHYACRTKHCEVYLNGEYQGVYLFSETIKRDKKRVNIAKMTDTTAAPSTITGGYIIKNDIFNVSNGWQTTFPPLDVPSLNPALIYHYPKFTNITLSQKAYLRTFVNQLETALYGSNFADTTVGYRKYIDVRSFHDYFIMQELTRNNDGFKKSCFFHKDRNTIDSKLKAGPVWDFDWAWKNIDDCWPMAFTDGSGWSYQVNSCGPDSPSLAWNVRLLEDSTYANELRCRWNELRQTVLHQDSIFAYINEKAAYLDAAQARHHAYWGNMGSDTGSPEMTTQPITYAGHVTQFRDWILQRMTWLDANMPGTCALVSSENLMPKTTKNAFTIFPNPAHGQFNVVLSDAVLNQISKQKPILNLYNTLGQNVYATSINATQTTQNIVLPTLPSGIYTVVLIANEVVLQNKLEIF
jgi:subtilisin-like proprotein convertase family protein